MFRITQDASSAGRINSYLIKTTRSVSTVLVVCAVGVWRHMQDLQCVCAQQGTECCGSCRIHHQGVLTRP
jgi:hypothetical protein